MDDDDEGDLGDDPDVVTGSFIGVRHLSNEEFESSEADRLTGHTSTELLVHTSSTPDYAGFLGRSSGAGGTTFPISPCTSATDISKH